MAATPYNPNGEYQPESTIDLPALYAWPIGGNVNTGAPLDRLFGSWHDGSRDSLQAQKDRLRKLRRQTT